MRLEVLRPELWWLLPLAPVAALVSLRTLADASRARAIAIAALRGAAVALVIAGLAQPRWRREADESRLCVIAAVDVSSSVPAACGPDCAREVGAIAAQAGADRRFGLVLFAGRAEVAIAPTATPPDQAAIAKVIGDALGAAKGSERFAALERDETRIEAALDLAASSFPNGLGRRIVVFSDGCETDGAAIRAAAALSRAGIDVHARALAAKDPPLDVLVAAVEAPTRVRTDEAYDVGVALNASKAAKGRVRLYRDGFLVASRDVELAEGSTRVVFRQSLAESGQHLYRAAFDTVLEQPTANDQGYAYVTATGKPRALVLGSRETANARLVSALTSQGIAAEYRDASGAPETMLDLIGFDAVVVDDAPAAQLGDERLRLLRDYVRDFGGGLVAVGGRSAFGAGGWSGTALEDALPVTCARERLSPLPTCVVVVIDTSRSLIAQRTADGSAYDAAGLVRATCSAIAKRLGANDVFGVVGTGDERAEGTWFVRPQPVYDGAALGADLDAALKPEAFARSSNIYRALRRVSEELSQRDTMRKAVIVLSDGWFDAGSADDYRGLAAMLASNGIQVSTVPIGPRADRDGLERIARWGGGCCFDQADAGAVATAVDAVLTAARSGDAVDEPFHPRRLADALVPTLDMTLAPDLYGYARTSLNLGATNVLAVPPQLDPLLASGDYGAGRSAAFTSDDGDRWSALWPRDWSRSYEQFWAGVVRGVMRDGSATLSPQVTASGQNLRVEADYLDAKRRFVDGQRVEAELYWLGEQGYQFSRAAVERFPLEPLAPGRYGASHRVTKRGLYALKVAAPARGHVAVTGFAVPDFAEHLGLGPDQAFLAGLARAGGGADVGDAAAAWSLAGKRRSRESDLGAGGLLGAVLLLVAEVLARRWPAIARAARKRIA